jgi:hypothetical protein
VLQVNCGETQEVYPDEAALKSSRLGAAANVYGFSSFISRFVVVLC